MSDASGRKMFKHSGTALLFRGILAVLFGFAIAALPVSTVFALVFVFGVFAIVDGLTNIAHYFYDPSRHSRWSLIGGFISIAAGLVAVAWPGMTAAALAVLIGLWALILGVSEIILAFAARSTMSGWPVWLLTGVVTALFGLLVILNPGLGFLAMAGFLAAFAVIAGLLLIVCGIRLRRGARSPLVYAN
ncbi:HdeD family acid-resistance protein [Paenarthrobacter sp. NPDC089989]|uniref:HdeD family acid-resistance protein n=1 Tax=unclassified Paenarthrobacter TaxID=2634190 RepID=UPI00382B6099